MSRNPSMNTKQHAEFCSFPETECRCYAASELPLDKEIDDEDFDEDGLGLDCGMGEDGQCQYAGTEECDECPVNPMNEEEKP